MEEKKSTGDKFLSGLFGYDEDCYIERNFRFQTIRKEIFNKESPPFILFIANVTKQQLKSLGAPSRKIHVVDANEISGSAEQWIKIPRDKSKNKPEELYKMLCQKNNNGHTVHWLNLVDGALVWKKCNGEMGDFVKYLASIDSAILVPYAESDIMNDRIVIVADSVGTGKTTMLRSVARKLEKESPPKCVYKFDLKHYAAEEEGKCFLKDVHFEGDDRKEEAIELLSQMIEFERPLDKIKFKHSCRDTSDIVIMFDGFDEINKTNQEKVIKLLKELKDGSRVRIWITTRFDEKNYLEANLDVLGYRLKPLIKKQQIQFLDTFWKKALQNLIHDDDDTPLSILGEYLKGVRHELDICLKEIEKPKHRIQILMLMNSITQMISISARAQDDGGKEKFKLSSTVVEKINCLNFSVFSKVLLKGVNAYNTGGKTEFSSVPLHLMLLGIVVLEKQFKIVREVNIYDLCEKFVEMKFDEYYKRKKRTPSMGNIYSSPEFFAYKEVALGQLLPNEASTSSLNLSEKFDRELLEEIGLAKQTEKCFQFVHQTLEEYFLCEWMVSDLRNEEVQRVLVEKILRESNYSAVRMFLNIQINYKQVRIHLTDKVIEDTDFFGVDASKGTFLHLLAEEGLESILEMFLEAFPFKIAEITLKTNSKSQNFMNVACEHCWNRVVKVILNFAKTHLPKETVEKMVLQKDDWEVSPFYNVGEKSFCDLFVDFLYDNNKKIGDEVCSYLIEINLLGNEKNLLSKTFIKEHPQSFSKMLEIAFFKFSQTKFRELVIEQSDADGNTCLHNLACVGGIENISQYCECLDKILSLSSLDTYIKQRNVYGDTVLHQSALGSNSATFHHLLKYAKSLLMHNGSVIEFLTMANNKGSTILHEAVCESDVEFIQQLCDDLEEEVDRETLVKFVLQSNNSLDTILHLALRRDAVDVMRLVCSYVKEVLNKEALQELLMAKTEEGFTPFHSGAEKGSVDTLRLVWDCADILDKESMQRSISMTNNSGDTVFHLSAIRGKGDILKSFLEYGLGILTKSSFNDVLTHVNSSGNTILHLCALNDAVDTSNCWFRFSAYSLDKKILKDCVTKFNADGDSVLHLSVKKGKIAVILQICNHAKSILGEEFIKGFLMNSDKSENTILHLAVFRGDDDILKQLLDFVKSELPNELQTNLIQQVNKDGDTVFHLGVKGRNQQVLKQLFDYIEGTSTMSIIKDLLVKRNVQGKTPLQMAYHDGGFTSIKDLCDCAKAVMRNEYLLEFLSNINDFGETLLHLAVHLEETRKVKEWSSYIEYLLEEEILEKMFLISNQLGDTVLHYVLRWRDSYIIIHWFDFARKILSKECLEEILSKTNNFGDTIMHLASAAGDLGATKYLCEYSKETLGKEYVKRTLLKCNKNGDAVLHTVVRKCETVAVKFWLDFIKEELGVEFLAELLPQINSHGESVLHLAVVRDDVEIMKILCDYTKDVFSSVPMEEFLTRKIKNGANVLHFIVTRGDIMMMNTFWEYCMSTLHKEALGNFISQTNGGSDTVLHLATIRGKLSILNQSFLYVKDSLSSESVKDIMTKRNFEGNGILHLATSKGRIDIISRLWEWYNDLLGDKSSDEFLQSTNLKGETILHIAAARSEIIFLNQLCDFCEEKLKKESLKILIMMPNREGSTCLHIATIEGETIVVNKLYDYAKNILEEKDLEIFFKKQNNAKDTVFHISVRGEKLSITMYLCEYARSIMSSESLRRLLTKPNSNGKTILDEAVIRGRNYYVESLWEYANRAIGPETRENDYRLRKAARTIDCCYTS